MAEPPGVGGAHPGGWAGQNNGPFFIAVMGSTTALALLFSAARIYCRLISIKRLAIEDYIVILSIVSPVAQWLTPQGTSANHLIQGNTHHKRRGRRCRCRERPRQAHCHVADKKRPARHLLHHSCGLDGHPRLHPAQACRCHSARQDSGPGPLASEGHVADFGRLLPHVGHHHSPCLGSLFTRGSPVGRGEGEVLEPGHPVHLYGGARRARGCVRLVPRHLSQPRHHEHDSDQLEEKAGPVVRAGLRVLVSGLGRCQRAGIGQSRRDANIVDQCRGSRRLQELYARNPPHDGEGLYIHHAKGDAVDEVSPSCPEPSVTAGISRPATGQ